MPGPARWNPDISCKRAAGSIDGKFHLCGSVEPFLALRVIKQTFATRTSVLGTPDTRQMWITQESLKNEHTLALLFCHPP
ncbi:MAG TPA: hypothetical protein VMM15_07095 [Bradyrhizobium sp.]|nr:hypothetical protein [Bradyrhizobium sp.]